MNSPRSILGQLRRLMQERIPARTDGPPSGGWCVPASGTENDVVRVQVNKAHEVTAITFGGTAPKRFYPVGANELECVLDARADGLVDIVALSVLGSVTMRDAFTYHTPVAPSSFDPASLALTLWLEDFAGAADPPDPGPGPWVSKASVGTSGAQNRRMIDMNIPAATIAVGPSLNGHASANFADTGDGRGQDIGGALQWGDILGPSVDAWYIGTLVRFNSFHANSGPGLRVYESHIIGDDGDNGPFSFADDGVKAYTWNYGPSGGGYFETAAQPLVAGQTYWVEVMYSGGVLSLFVNGSSVGSTNAIEDMSPNTVDPVLIGRGSALPNTHCDMDLFCLMAADQAFNGATRANIKSYINTRFGLAL